jgi:uncharacterized protein (TIGR02266 family)
VSERDSGEATFTDAEDDSGSDRRQHRYDVDLSVTVNSEHNFLAGAATNLSAGGVFISTSIVHPVGTEFNISIHLDDGNPGVVKGKGVVRWHQQAPTDDTGPPQGLGIQFIEIEGDGEERIRTFLASRKPMENPED